MTTDQDGVLRQLPVDPDYAPERVELPEIVVLPPEPEPMLTVEEVNARQEQAARDAAWTFHMQTCTGIYLPLPDLEPWPERYRRAFRDELARLEAAARARRAEGGPS